MIRGCVCVCGGGACEIYFFTVFPLYLTSMAIDRFCWLFHFLFCHSTNLFHLVLGTHFFFDLFSTTFKKYFCMPVCVCLSLLVPCFSFHFSLSFHFPFDHSSILRGHRNCLQSPHYIPYATYCSLSPYPRSVFAINTWLSRECKKITLLEELGVYSVVFITLLMRERVHVCVWLTKLIIIIVVVFRLSGRYVFPCSECIIERSVEFIYAEAAVESIPTASSVGVTLCVEGNERGWEKQGEVQKMVLRWRLIEDGKDDRWEGKVKVKGDS